jgi:hypothetical protein
VPASSGHFAADRAMSFIKIGDKKRGWRYMGTMEVVVIGLIIVVSAVAVLYFIRRSNA